MSQTHCLTDPRLCFRPRGQPHSYLKPVHLLLLASSQSFLLRRVATTGGAILLSADVPIDRVVTQHSARSLSFRDRRSRRRRPNPLGTKTLRSQSSLPSLSAPDCGDSLAVQDVRADENQHGDKKHLGPTLPTPTGPCPCALSGTAAARENPIRPLGPLRPCRVPHIAITGRNGIRVAVARLVLGTQLVWSSPKPHRTTRSVRQKIQRQRSAHYPCVHACLLAK